MLWLIRTSLLTSPRLWCIISHSSRTSTCNVFLPTNTYVVEVTIFSEHAHGVNCLWKHTRRKLSFRSPVHFHVPRYWKSDNRGCVLEMHFSWCSAATQHLWDNACDINTPKILTTSYLGHCLGLNILWSRFIPASQSFMLGAHYQSPCRRVEITIYLIRSRLIFERHCLSLYSLQLRYCPSNLTTIGPDRLSLVLLIIGIYLILTRTLVSRVEFASPSDLRPPFVFQIPRGYGSQGCQSLNHWNQMLLSCSSKS